MNTATAYIEKYYPYIWVILFFISYLLFYPENWMITDAYNYVNRGIAFSRGSTDLFVFDFITGNKINLIPAPYNTGTSIFFGLAIALLGKKSLFLVPLFQVIISVFLVSETIKRNSYSNYGLVIWGLSLSLMFFSRSAMSCMPSLMMVSIASYIFFRKELKNKHLISLGILAGFCLWFRESNIFLIAPFIIYSLYKDIRSAPLIGLGIILGLSPKLLMDKWVYGSFWFQSASSGFSINGLIDHFPEYSIILLCLLPISIVFIGLYKGKGDKSIKVSSIAFVLLYLFYNYTAVEFSGLIKGSLLTSRFMIPLLPIASICAAEVISRKGVWKKLAFPFSLVSLLLIPSSQFIFHELYENHEKAAMQVSEITNKMDVFVDFSGYTNIIRYFNPLSSEISSVSSIQNIKELKSLDNDQYLLLSRSIESEEKKMRADSIWSLSNHLSIEIYKKIPIDDTNWLEIYRGK